MDTLIGTLIGVGIGYYLGKMDGSKGLTELGDARVALDKITASEEFKAMRSSALPIASAVLQNAFNLVGGSRQRD